MLISAVEIDLNSPELALVPSVASKHHIGR